MKTKRKAIMLICKFSVIACTTCNAFPNFFTNCVKQLYAGPTGIWGKEITLQNCFGESVGCRFSTSETPIEAPIRYQVKLNNKKWQEYKEDKFVYGQDIKVRATSTLTGGYVKILAQCSCKCD